MGNELSVNLQALATWLGVSPVTLLAITIVLMTGFNIIGRVIPDSATGWLGNLRKVCKVLGLFIQNRVLPGITASEVALSAHSKATQANAVAHVAAEAAGVEIITPPPPPTPSELAGRAALATTNGISHASER